jgi:hypothetical protein
MDSSRNLIIFVASLRSIIVIDFERGLKSFTSRTKLGLGYPWLELYPSAGTRGRLHL